jgi:hypothetical protein
MVYRDTIMKQQMQAVTLDQIPGYQGKVLIPVDADLDCEGYVSVTITKGTRTTKQNSAIQQYWRLVSKALNDSGWTKKKYYDVKEVDIGWTPESVGDDIWRGIQEAMFQHRNTSKLEPKQVNAVYEVMAKHLSLTCRVTTPFPTWRHEG